MTGQEDKEQEILVTRSSLPSYEEYIEMIKPIWDSAWLTNMGDLHKQLEKELKEYMGIRNMVLFVNGHMALEMAIQALELTGEVITTPCILRHQSGGLHHGPGKNRGSDYG